MTLVTAKATDWVRHRDSSPDLLPQLEFSGGPVGGVQNALRFELDATSALQKVAYSNRKLGGLRGAGRFSVSSKFSADADRTKTGVLVRWNPTHLDAGSAGYMAELGYDLIRSGSDGAASTGANTKITSATADFAAADRGRSITLIGAGPSGADYTGAIVAVDSATQVTVAPVIYTNVSGSAWTLSELTCGLREGPDEAGAVIFLRRLHALYGFVSEQWVEVGLELSFDTVGNLKLMVLIRPNPERGIGTDYSTFQIDVDLWFLVGVASISRHEARSIGQAGWQVLTRAGAGTLRVGNFRAQVMAAPPLTLLPDVVVL